MSSNRSPDLRATNRVQTSGADDVKEKAMYQVLAFLAREPGVSVGQFREHYERQHVTLMVCPVDVERAVR